MIRSREVCAFALVVCCLAACSGNEAAEEEPELDAAAHADSGDDLDADISDADAALDAGGHSSSDASQAKDGSLADARVMDGAPGPGTGSDAAPAPDAVTPDASPELDPDADELEPDGGVVIPGIRSGPSGRECHDGQASGQLLLYKMVSAPWPAATGGTIAPGTYELEAEERLVAPGASESDAALCDQFEGPYRENLVVRAGQYQRVYEGTSGAFVREVFDYGLNGTSLIRTQICPTEIDFPPPALSYSATADTLVLLDANISSCQYLYKYRRKP